MCGIVGYISNNQKDIDKALDVINHRGPDATGKIIHQVNNKYLGLGHKRLSIIDVDESSNQPFVSNCQNYSLVYNGEIYNYKILKEVLIDLGVVFKTNGDTEVLLNWLMKFGTSRLNEIEGMFAFGFFDKLKNELIIARDSLGIKPVYYTKKDNNLYFGSELKSIFCLDPKTKIIDAELLSEYLLTTFIYEPETGFKDILKVKPGHFIRYSLNTLETNEFPYINIYRESDSGEINSVVDEINHTINNHMVSDVPIGLFFSGGVDSTVILSQTKNKIKNLTIGSELNRSESSGMSSDIYYANKISEELEVDLIKVNLEDNIKSNQDFLDAIKEVALWNEELNLDFTYISSYLLALKAKENGLTVMQSGMGADEIFAGYDRYKLVKFQNLFKLILPFSFILRKMPSFSKKIDRFRNYFNESNFGLRYSSLIGYFNKEEVNQLTNGSKGVHRFQTKLDAILQNFAHKSNLKKVMGLDSLGFLAHNFSVADKSSMRASIEMRVPLATGKLFNLTWNLKDKKLLNFKRTKLILKNLLYDKIPKNLVDRKKAGFNAPLDDFIMDLGEEFYLSSLSNTHIYKFLNEEKVKEIAHAHFVGKANNTYKLYQFLHLAFWIDNYYEEEK